VEHLFSEVLEEQAAIGPLIVLIDEVETIATDRARLSLETNPVDVIRAVDAALVGLDRLARRFSNVLILATSNGRPTPVAHGDGNGLRDARSARRRAVPVRARPGAWHTRRVVRAAVGLTSAASGYGAGHRRDLWPVCAAACLGILISVEASYD
jgi:hypothetical protein